MPTIKISLSLADVEKALKDVQDYEKKVERLGEKVVKRLTEDGAKQAQDYAMYMNAYDSGELVSGIVPEFHDEKGYIHSTAPHTAFVEMGTGIVGSRNPNLNGTNPAGWEGYDIHGHGDSGWNYPGKDGKMHWTKGMPSRPFMYDTAQTLKQSIPYVVEDELKK